MSFLKNSFNAGEFGPRLRYRADLAKYQSACTELVNFFPSPWGGIENRPGTLFAASFPAGKTRLIPFVFNVEATYLIVAQNNKFHILKENAAVAEVTSPYAADELAALTFIQSNDVLFIAHPNHPPAMLSRVSDTAFTLEAAGITGGPWLDEDPRGVKLTASATSGSVTVTADDAVFESGMAGTKIRFAMPLEKNAITHTFTADETGTETLLSQGTWSVRTVGSFVGTLHIERSTDNGTTWEFFRNYEVNAERSISDTGYEEEKALYRMRFSGWVAPPEGTLYECRASFSTENYETFGVLRIDSVTSGTAAQCTVTELLPDTTSENWSFSAWDAFHGYPALVQFSSGDRLVFARSKAEPNRVWLSRVGDYTNFTAGTDASSAMLLTVRVGNGAGCVTGNAISFLANRKGLIVGSWAEIGRLGAKDESAPLAPDNKQYVPETNPGADDFQPIQINDCLLFVRRGAENLMELSYNYATDGYLAPDMTILCPDILRDGGGIREIAFVELPYPVVYCLRQDGVIASFTYNRAEEVTAWARQILPRGAVESIAVLQAADGYDRLYLAVRRGEIVTVEQLAKREDFGHGVGVWLDCATIASGATVTGLSRFASASVTAVIDGTAYRDLAVGADGTLALPVSGSRVVVGIPYESRVETLPLELVQGSESTLSVKKRTPQVFLKYFHTLGGRVRCSSGEEFPLVFRDTADVANGPVSLKDGTRRVAVSCRWDYETTISVRQADPYPMTLLALIMDYENA